MAEPATSKAAATAPVARPVKVARTSTDTRVVPDSAVAPVASAVTVKAIKEKASKPRKIVRVRQVKRVVHHVDTWSVFRLAVLFFLTLYVVLLVAGVLLWTAFASTGTLDKVENFIRKSFSLDTFQFSGAQIFQGSLAFGAVMVVAGSALVVILTVFFNIFSQLTGGLRMTVLEEETQLVNGTD
jgi:hypothetical protein